jgi:quercetin dioxygenase-like cupin family protein
MRAASSRSAKKDQPYHLKRGDGRTHDVGIEITVKAGEARTTHGAAVIEFVTRKGEEPGDHVHKTEDEMFYVLGGHLAFTCDGKRFNAGPGSFVFLPKGLIHNYAIRGNEVVRLPVITAPRRRQNSGWGGFVGEFESGS